jgi:hypothetical protein
MPSVQPNAAATLAREPRRQRRRQRVEHAGAGRGDHDQRGEQEGQASWPTLSRHDCVIQGAAAAVTGAASGIGRALALNLRRAAATWRWPIATKRGCSGRRRDRQSAAPDRSGKR